MPSPNKFQVDLAQGEKGERHVATTLKKYFDADGISRIGKGKGFDFKLTYGGLYPDDVFEVKTDFRAKTSGNLFFEYECNGKLSGLTATEANMWAVLVPHLQSILVFKPCRMFAFLKECPKARKINGGDRNAVKGYVIAITELKKLDFILEIPTKTRLTTKVK